MKKVLLLLSFFFSWAFLTNVTAQCTPYNFQTILKDLTVNGNVATATLDISFDIKANGGNKYIFVHLWTGSNYNNVSIIWGSSGQKAPTAVELNGNGNSHQTLYNLAINNNAVPPSYLSSYVYSGVNVTNPGGSPYVNHLANGADSFVIKDVVVSFDAAQLSTPGSIISGVIWSSNANSYASSMSVQCYLSGATFLADPVISGLSTCKDYTIKVTHNSLTSGSVLSGSYNVYVDSDNSGQYSGTDQQIAGAIPINNVTASTLNGAYYTGYQVDPGSIPTQYKGMNLFVVATVSVDGGSSIILPAKFIATTACSPLPVSFKSFSASRNNQTVSLKWETAFEQNNRGFYVQRNVNGEWRDVAFVFSRAEGGNSDQVLSYAYNDPSNLKTISYYRILQVDLDGKGKYSEIRAVKGLEQTSKLMLFPNPGTSGKINVLFGNEASAKNILVYDATGRVVKSFKNVMDNSLSIDQLKPGIYNIQVTDLASQITSSDKFIIKD